MAAWLLLNISLLSKIVTQIVKVNDGWTPLHYASESGHMNTILYLITELGCDPTTPDQQWQSPTAHCMSLMATWMLLNISLLSKIATQIFKISTDQHLYIMLLKVVT